jgi:SWI/SNF-related matrix-associated actin-dependent regulator of chromatin subfamily A-like protein 1
VNLYPYQAEGVAFLAARRNAMLLDQMGVGKTVQAIRAADEILAVYICVVCPAIARENWRREFAMWQTIPRNIAVVTSSADLLKPEVIGANVLIISYSLLASPKARKLLGKRRNGVLILDEAHNLKNPKAVRSRAVYGHRYDRKPWSLASTADRVWLLSGTIMPANPSELWSHLHALFGETRKYSEFVREFCTTYDDGFAVKITGGKNEKALAARLKPHVLRRRTQDVLQDLPPIRWSHVVVSPDKLPPKPVLPPEEVAVLASIRAKLAAGDTDGLAAAAMHLATLRKWTGVAKAAAVAELLAGETDKVVVFAIHRDVIDCILSMLGSSAVAIDGRTPDTKKTQESPDDRQTIIDNFQHNKEPRVLICQLSIASTALTLTAAHNVVFAENPWVPADLQQAAKRCHRIGQTQPVLVRIISLAGSIDEDINATLLRKATFGRNFDLALSATQSDK